MKPDGQRPPRFARALWLNLAALTVIAIAFAVYVLAEKQIDRANESRLQSFLLADELRQSSDDLTRMVRTYVATSDPLFKQQTRKCSPSVTASCRVRPITRMSTGT